MSTTQCPRVSRIDGEAPATLMAECLDGLGTIRRPLIVDEGSGRLATACRSAGREPVVWLRAAVAGLLDAPRPWPPEGQFDGALIRLPKAKDALELALHAAASRLVPGAPIAVFGANAEGIRSVPRHLETVADQVETLATGHHSRVIWGRGRRKIDGHRARLLDWRQVREVAIAGASRTWVSYPGTFAKGGVDDGTAFLIRQLATLPPAHRVLDFAAGTGVIAAAVAMLSPGATTDLVEADTLAIEAARENVPGARALIGDGIGAAGDRRYDLIVSNPPVHEGIAESRRVLDGLIAEAPRHLEPHGRLLLVVQRRIPVMAALAASFAKTRVVGDDGRFTVAVGEFALRGR